MTATATPTNQGQRRPGLPANANGATRPNLATARNETPQDINSILRSPKTVERFKAIVPRHLSAERMLRVMALAVHKTPELAQANPITLLGAMMVLASLGIEPNTPLGHAYLIPFGKRKKVGDEWVTESVEVNVVLGYRGLIDLARRSGTLVSIHADIVYEGDEFSFEYGSNMHLRHIPIGAREGRKPLWAYAHAKLKDGEAFEVLPYDQVLAVRDGSEGYKSALRAKADAARGQKYRMRAFETAPWIKYEHEMAAKTMIRRVSKKLPMSIEFANAARLDEMSEANAVNYDAFAALEDSSTLDVDAASREPEQIEHQDEQPMDTTVGAGQQQGHDPETGEVHEDKPTPQQRQAQPAANRTAGNGGGNGQRRQAPAQQQPTGQQPQQGTKPAAPQQTRQQAPQPQQDRPYADDNDALTRGLPPRQQQRPAQQQAEPQDDLLGGDQDGDQRHEDDGGFQD